MLTKTILVALLTCALVGSSVPAGYAGGGGAGNPGGILMFQCYAVEHGKRPAQALSVDDQFTNPTNERPGKLKMVCTLADFQVTKGPDLTVVENPDHLTCYETPDARATASVVTLTDGFGSQTVNVRGASKFLCVQAEKACLSGCPVVSPPQPE